MSKFTVLTLIIMMLILSCTSREVTVKENSTENDSFLIGPKKRVAVADFSVEPVYGKRLGNASSGMMISALQDTGRFILVERERLSTIMEEQKLAMAGLEDTSTAVTIGSLAGADAIIIGSVTKFGVNITSSDAIIGSSKTQTASAEVSVRLIDTGTGMIVMAETGAGKAVKTYSSFLGIGSTGGYDESLEGDALKAAISNVVDKIVLSMKKVPWNCRIAKKLGNNTVIIDAGRASNLTVGTLLTVIRRGEAIKSPSSGETLGYDEEIIGTLKVTEYFGDNGAYCDILTDKGIFEGGICRLK